jgi:DNA polymerase-3 subunit gamma/tau
VCEVCKAITNGSALDVIEIDAASNTGVENIRDLIERAQFAPVQCRYKVYVIDECHMLSVSAFNSLLKTLEEPPNRVVFVLATTDPQRVLPTIISRCQRFDFRRIPLEAMVAHLRKIASIENINITQSAVQLVAQVSQGGLRDAESLLDQLSLLSGQVTVERVWDLLGSCSEPDLIELLQAIARNNPEAVLDCARRVMDRGREPLTVLQNLAGFYRDLLIAKTAPSRKDLVAVTPSSWKALCEQANNWDIPSILAGQQHLAKSEVQIKNTTQPRLWLEVALLGLFSTVNSHQPEGYSLRQHSEHSRASITAQQPAAQPSAPVPSHASNDVNETQSKSPLLGQVASISQTPPIPREHPEPSNSSVSIPDPPPEVEPLPSASQPLSVVDSPSQTPREPIWQQVLANLQPISTRELLRQLCHLIEFDGAFARIGITSEPWYKKAQAHLPNIKAAFQETFKREVQVSLELTTPTATKTASVNELQSSSRFTAPANSPQITEPLASDLATTLSNQAQAFTQFQPGMAAGEATASKDSESSMMGITAYPPTAAPGWEEDEVTIAAQRLADFFKGEVVKLNLDSTLPDATNTNSLQPIATSASDWNDADLAVGEADIDF